MAQFLLIRQEILESDSPMKLIRTLPDLDSKRIIGKTTQILHHLPKQYYDRLKRHMKDISVWDSFKKQVPVNRDILLNF